MRVDGNLLVRCKSHDWESIERHDLIDRLDLMNDLKVVSLAELAPIFKACGPRKTVLILDLLRRFKSHGD